MNDNNDTAAAAVNLDDLTDTKVWTIEDVLATARTVETIARVCLRADLQATYEGARDELATLVTIDGKLVNDSDDDEVDDEALNSPGRDTDRERAKALAETATRAREQMLANMWTVRFKGMDSETFAMFNKKNAPKDGDALAYNHLLVAACAVDPALTYEQVQALSKKLGPQQMGELISKAGDSCTKGGLNVPKLPGFLTNLALGTS